MRHFYILLSLFIVLFSCKKEDPEAVTLQSPSTIVTTSNSDLEPVLSMEEEHERLLSSEFYNELKLNSQLIAITSSSKGNAMTAADPNEKPYICSGLSSSFSLENQRLAKRFLFNDHRGTDSVNYFEVKIPNVIPIEGGSCGTSIRSTLYIPVDFEGSAMSLPGYVYNMRFSGDGTKENGIIEWNINYQELGGPGERFAALMRIRYKS